MARHLFWLALVAVAIGSVRPAHTQQQLDSNATQSRTRYAFAVVKNGRSVSEPPVYRIPEIAHVRLQTVCESGLLTEIVEKGAIVKIQFNHKPLTEEVDPRLLKIGTHIESVKPKQFSPGDQLMITVQNYAIAG